MPPKCVLIGPPGSGKSTVGALVAERLRVEFRDTDTDIAAQSGKSISEIFLEDGEPVFRALEVDAVKAALQSHDGVLALGGGAVMHSETQRELRECGSPVVFLDVSITHAAPRIGFNRDRPLLLVNPRAQWVALMAARRATYEQVSDFVVATDEKSPDDVAAEVVAVIPA